MDTLLPSQILKNGWCQVFQARNKHKLEVSFDSSEAISHCISGALLLSTSTGKISDSERIILRNIIDTKTAEMGFITFVHYNDAFKRTQEEVVELVKNAEHEAGLFVQG